ncbi:CPBP family intramembrane metalloprotease [Bacillus luteolus]|uniref:CPBP family intramembrane metalloprotease n=1 Tax=Litchfieldia luteola TaxID=682179 RepID=A0ABR9QM28_9BACI|nr:CPBP family intramembrane glutamic endopeptidase [Cytobacillus luteolus]MBE4909565.1 CPBP family intramembrane metalloprotease [Cytobacillus luteolus]MBP1940966.1 membrane protease YdiL (CAAX protease family) [Cytobacillus luteolus]
MTDKKNTVFAILFAHLFLLLSFTKILPFWPMFTVALFILSALSIYKKRFSFRINGASVGLGILTGILLYLIFAIGKQILLAIGLPVEEDLKELYSFVSPTQIWHYIVLTLIIIPGEELFWRGYIQPSFSEKSAWNGIIYATLLYASVHIYSGSTMLILAAIVGGLYWGLIYVWKKNIVINIVSHFTFNLFLLVILPLN